MKKSKATPRKLVLQRDAIKRLTVEDLRTVRGGVALMGCSETDCKSDTSCSSVTSIQY